MEINVKIRGVWDDVIKSTRSRLSVPISGEWDRNMLSSSYALAKVHKGFTESEIERMRERKKEILKILP